jgi:hypothetical protein
MNEMEEEYENPEPTLDQHEESIDEDYEFEPNQELNDLLTKKQRTENAILLYQEDADFDAVASTSVELTEIEHQLEDNYSQEEIDTELKRIENE